MEFAYLFIHVKLFCMNTSTDNYVRLQGHLGQDIDLREFAQGRKLAKVSLATTEFKKATDGPPDRITSWHNLTAWGKTAEEMSTTLRKGSKVCVEGKISYRQYETKAGEKRYATEITVNAFQKIEKEEPVS
jgi:single-strand DNA-binding protein